MQTANIVCRRLEAVNVLSRLPPELRVIIYKLIANSWSSFTAYPETIDRHNDPFFKVNVARRNKVPTYGTLFDAHCPLPPCLAVCGKSCPNDSAFEQKYGALDYFKPNEWEGVVAATRAMEEYGANQNCDIGKHSFSAVSVENMVEDFINWLWGTIVVDVKFRKTSLLPPQGAEQRILVSVSYSPNIIRLL